MSMTMTLKDAIRQLYTIYVYVSEPFLFRRKCQRHEHQYMSQRLRYWGSSSLRRFLRHLQYLLGFYRACCWCPVVVSAAPSVLRSGKEVAHVSVDCLIPFGRAFRKQPGKNSLGRWGITSVCLRSIALAYRSRQVSKSKHCSHSYSLLLVFPCLVSAVGFFPDAVLLAYGSQSERKFKWQHLH